MPTFRASWILPITGPPIRHGWVATHAGHIAAVGRDAEAASGSVASDAVIDLGEVAVLPALVNAHTHLELSWLRQRVPPARGFISWVSSMMRERLSAPDGRDEGRVRAAVTAAMSEMRATGTGVVGDISNSLANLDLLASSGLAGVVFHEIIKFRAPDGGAVVQEAEQRLAAIAPMPSWRLAVAPHAPYSVSPAVFEALRDARALAGDRPSSVHVSESRDEVEFVQHGSGGWRELLKRLGSWDPEWRTPDCSPIEYLDRLGFWDHRTLAVHAVQATPEDLRLLAARGTTIVTCPRSNVHVGAGNPPIAAFYESGAGVAVGTDSLASVADLNLFSELAAMHRLAPGIDPSRLLRSATIEGATALGFDRDFGSIAPGKRAALVAVSIPPGTKDVEQCLVSGIFPEQIQWVESCQPS